MTKWEGLGEPQGRGNNCVGGRGCTGVKGLRSAWSKICRSRSASSKGCTVEEGEAKSDDEANKLTFTASTLVEESYSRDGEATSGQEEGD